jgi:hypothetical protein
MVGDANASGWILCEAQVEEILPGQPLLLSQVNEGEGVTRGILCSQIGYSGGKQVSNADAHGFNNALQGATSKTFKEDLSFITQANTEAGLPIMMCWTTSHPAA